MMPIALALLLIATQTRGAAPVSLGVDVLLSGEGGHIARLAHKRVGLVTNPSGVDGALIPTADRLFADERVELVRLFGPEHGIRGDVPAGEKVMSETDPVTGLPVVSLYGAKRRPAPEDLEGLDALVFDIQDLGSRTYTYVSTLGECMHAAALAGIPLIVLDRPNPIGGLEFEGAVREQEWHSFLGWGPLPVSHGMTLGEVARFYEQELQIGCELHVVPMRGWRREMVWEDTGLDWTQTSPHIPHALHAHLYIATGMIGGVTENVNEGVGYTLPFETLAAEFIEPARFAAAMNAARLPGVRFVTIAYTPYYGRHEGLALGGVRLILDDAHAFRPLRTALTAMVVLERLYPGQVVYKQGRWFNIHWGNERILPAIRAQKSVLELEASWAAELAGFAAKRRRALLY